MIIIIKSRIDKTQQNSRCWLCDGRDETISHIISEYSKLAQKEYITRHDWMGKVIYREFFKQLKFDHMNKWYMHNLASVLENETHKLQWDFKIQTDLLISARRSDITMINKEKRKKKKTCRIVNFVVPADYGIKLKESEKKGCVPGPC